MSDEYTSVKQDLERAKKHMESATSFEEKKMWNDQMVMYGNRLTAQTEALTKQTLPPLRDFEVPYSWAWFKYKTVDAGLPMSLAGGTTYFLTKNRHYGVGAAIATYTFMLVTRRGPPLRSDW